MRSTIKIMILALLLCGLMAFSLFACDNGEDPTTAPTDEITTEAPTEDPTEDETTEDTTEDETTENTTEEVSIEEETTYEEVTGDYSNGNGIGAAGAFLDDDAFVLTTNTVDESKAVTKTAAEMLALLENKNGMKAGEVYKVTEPLTLASDKTYYGNLAAIIAEGGVVIKDISGITLREVIIKGSITVENSSEINFYKLDVKGGSIGITVDNKSSEIAVLSSIINAVDIAVSSNGANVSVYQSKLVAKTGLTSTGTDFTIQSSIIEAENSGMTSSGKYFIARNNTITVSNIKNGVGIELTNGSYNSMAALNVINDVQTSVKVTEGYNCVVILNRAISITASNNKHFYMIKNRIGGEIVLKNNNYIIADGNTFIEDNRYHPTTLENNSNFNGDNMHDITVRLEYGANEELLPHTDTEQFTNMEMRTEITDLSSSQTFSYSAYVKDAATWNKIVIVPPGAYTSSSAINIGTLQSNTDLYTYGALAEAQYTVGNIMKVDRAENVNVFGFTGRHNRSTCGQVHVLAMDESTNTVIVTVSAGFVDGFYTLDPTDPRDDCGYNPDFLSIYHATEDLSDIDAADTFGGHGSILKSRADKGVVDNGDGTYTIYMSTLDKLELGDIMVTRLGKRGQNSLSTYMSNDIYYKDLTLYSSTNSRNQLTYCGQVTYERFSSPRPRGYEITEEVFKKYEAMEEQYGVNLGVYYDEEYGIYRGPDPIWGATACMEITGNYNGAHVISSYWRSTTDDGTNQRGNSGRLAGLEDNGDGTYTVYYKGNLGSVYRNSTVTSLSTAGGTSSITEVATLEEGNTILAYAPDGQVLINDAIVLTAPKAGSAGSNIHLAHTGTGTLCETCGKKVRDGYTYQELSNTYDPATGKLTFTTRGVNNDVKVTWNTTIWSVTIDAKYVNEEIIDNYDLCLNTDQAANRITFDNVSRNCQGIYYDNVLITDVKSRAILAKANDVTIKNCTFRNLTLQALVLGAEEEWSESTVARNVLIENCLFDNCAKTTEYAKEHQISYDAEPNICPIDIRGLSTTKEAIISEATPHANMVASNFVIRNNKFINTPNKHMISVTGACDVLITGNVFEEREGDGEIIYINACYNVKVIDNKYTERIQAAFEKGNYNPIADIYNCEKVVVENLKIPEKVTMKPN